GGSTMYAGADMAFQLGKTGTAENPAGKDHAWFIGSAELPERKIVFAIIVENGGGGGIEAAPIAKQMIESLM
ncbi:penicillin-binding transpeptidase domain-containing protein, partial [Mitsuokella jalaludinii]|uniref:penicillin-binding transpeptidase domain-containing protein n=1 Tax=Mitsuokella jalaludinii TaxID=187979 RepID=UPI00307F43F9